MSWYGGFAPYVPVAERKRKAAKEVNKLKKKGQVCQPIVLEGRTIANTFWGKSWCNHLESYSDYANRLPRGRTYVRNGSVIDLSIKEGEINALVSGSSIYKVNITMTKVVPQQWNEIVDECAGKIDSLIELLQGKFSKAVMQIITDPQKGLFPDPKEIKLSCSCPDWAEMCKHVAAVLYGVGARLDNKPEELFILRQADHSELITKAATSSLNKSSDGGTEPEQILDSSDLSSLFGIDMGDVGSEKKTKQSGRKVGVKREVRVKREAGVKREVPAKRKVAVNQKAPAKEKVAVKGKLGVQQKTLAKRKPPIIQHGPAKKKKIVKKLKAVKKATIKKTTIKKTTIKKTPTKQRVSVK